MAYHFGFTIYNFAILGVPNLYKNGDLSKTKSVERWFRHIMEETNIEEVTPKMFERLRK